MFRTNCKLEKYAVWKDDEGESWRHQTHIVLGTTQKFVDINASILEIFVDYLPGWYAKETDRANYFVMIGILRTYKEGRQVSSVLFTISMFYI